MTGKLRLSLSILLCSNSLLSSILKSFGDLWRCVWESRVPQSLKTASGEDQYLPQLCTSPRTHTLVKNTKPIAKFGVHAFLFPRLEIHCSFCFLKVIVLGSLDVAPFFFSHAQHSFVWDLLLLLLNRLFIKLFFFLSFSSTCSRHFYLCMHGCFRVSVFGVKDAGWCYIIG